MSVTSDVTPRRNGYDFAAMGASAATQGSGDEVARLRAAVETLSQLVLSHGVMDARTLKVLLGELLLPPMVPVALSAPLPPPAAAAAQVARPVAQAAAPEPVAAPVAAPAPVTPAAPAPVAPAAPVTATATTTATMTAAPARSGIDATRLAEVLSDAPVPVLKKPGFFARLFGKGKASPAAVAAAAAQIEFTERMPKLPSDGLYSEHQRATELSFPPPATLRKPRAAAAPRKRTRPADAGPTRFCDRCWRRLDAAGDCKTCGASA